VPKVRRKLLPPGGTRPRPKCPICHILGFGGRNLLVADVCSRCGEPAHFLIHAYVDSLDDPPKVTNRCSACLALDAREAEAREPEPVEV